MVLHSNRRFVGFLFCISTGRHHFPCLGPFIKIFQFSTHIVPSNSALSPNENHILNELAELLPISHHNTASNLYKESNSAKLVEQSRDIGQFLLPEEKLRGVFLRKLKGKTKVEQALSNVPVDLNLHVFAEVVNRGNLSGESMVMFFNWAIKQPMFPKEIDSYNIIFKALGRRKFFESMMRSLNDMKDKCISPNLDTLSILMDSFIRARRVYKAIQLFGNLEEFGFACDSESLDVLLQCLCQRGHVGAATLFLNSMEGKMQLNIITYNIVIGGWSKLGKVNEIEKILKAMMTAGFNPDCLTFSYLIEGLGRADRVDDAVNIFDNMKDKGCIPNSTAYNAMIFNFISIGDFDGGMKYYKALLSSNCEPDMETFIRLISAFLKHRKVADALEMFDEMISRGFIPSTGTITSFIEPLCSYGPPYAAMMIYKKSRKIGCKVSISAYKLLLMRLSRFGKCGMVLNLWHDMQENRYSSDTEVYEYIINGLCNNGQLENAVLVMEEALQKGFCPNKLIYSKLKNKLLDSNKVERAYRLYLKMKKARQLDNARKYWRHSGWHF
ncbi:hypothetical protein ACFE04_025737 [Oxalis oulophora]